LDLDQGNDRASPASAYVSSRCGIHFSQRPHLITFSSRPPMVILRAPKIALRFSRSFNMYASASLAKPMSRRTSLSRKPQEKQDIPCWRYWNYSWSKTPQSLMPLALPRNILSEVCKSLGDAAEKTHKENV
jgi:hypothetical protein